jgi:hypothetical protein
MSERRAILDPGFLGDVQTWEDKTNETIMVLESNSEIFVLLKKFYTNLVTDEAFPDRERKRCRQVVRNFASQLDELIYDTNMQIRRARVLVKIVADRKTIVCSYKHLMMRARRENLTNRSLFNMCRRKLQHGPKSSPSPCMNKPTAAQTKL